MGTKDRYFRIKTLFDMTAKDFAELFNAFEDLSPVERQIAIHGDYYEWPE